MDIIEAPSEGLSAVAASAEEIARFITDAGVQAPSAHKTQPWQFYQGRSQDQHCRQQ